MKRKRLIALLMAAVTVSASFVGCGEKEEKSNGETTTKEESSGEPIEVSIAIWGAEDGLSDPNDPIYKKLVEETGVKLVPQNITWDDSGQKIQLWATNGQLPDIFVGDYVGTSFFLQTGWNRA